MDQEATVLPEQSRRSRTSQTQPRQRYPGAAIVLTCGEKGVLFSNAEEELQQEAYKVREADTTAAGDTFIGLLASPDNTRLFYNKTFLIPDLIQNNP